MPYRALALIVAFLGALALFAPARSLGADKPAVYTDAQATAGATVFANSCAGCHGQNLEGVSGPPLAGQTFVKNWQGKSADDLFYIISHNMPADNPGSLKPDQYVDVLAFILQKNGYPAGSTPLDPSKLTQILITQ
jgi:polar amino acid transport system substrate-binding protein